MKITTKFIKLRDFQPCSEGVDKLLDYVRPTETGSEVDLLTVLDVMGANYTLWALCVANTSAELLASRITYEFSSASLAIAEAYGPQLDAVSTAREFIDGRLNLGELISAQMALSLHNARIHSLLMPLSGMETNPYRNAIAAANTYGEILATMVEYLPKDIEARKVAIIRKELEI